LKNRDISLKAARIHLQRICRLGRFAQSFPFFSKFFMLFAFFLLHNDFSYAILLIEKTEKLISFSFSYLSFRKCLGIANAMPRSLSSFE